MVSEPPLELRSRRATSSCWFHGRIQGDGPPRGGRCGIDTLCVHRIVPVLGGTCTVTVAPAVCLRVQRS